MSIRIALALLIAFSVWWIWSVTKPVDKPRQPHSKAAVEPPLSLKHIGQQPTDSAQKSLPNQDLEKPVNEGDAFSRRKLDKRKPKSVARHLPMSFHMKIKMATTVNFPKTR